MQPTWAATVTRTPLAQLRRLPRGRAASPSAAALVASVPLASLSMSMMTMTMTSSSSPHAGHASWRTAAFEVRGLRSSRRSPQPRSRRCYTTTATAASTPASAAEAGGSASTRPQTTRRRHVMDLGSKLSVGLPGPGPSPTPSSPRHHRGSRRHHGRTTSKGNAADGAVHVQSREALKQPPPSLRHPRQATPTSLLPRQQHATPGEREGDEAGLLRIPRTAAEAVALLECATVLEALEPSSSAHLPPCSAAPPSKSAGAAPSDVRANFEELGTRALPLLFHFAQVAATSSAPLAGDAAASVTDAKLAAALQCLAAHLQYMAAATRTDGLRHVSALPPAVVVALWEQVMPSVHQRFCKAKAPPPLPSRQGNLVELVEVEEGGDGTGATTELRNAADALASSTRVAATRPAPTASMKKSVYVPLRRALALHTRQIASLLPPPALALVLTRMYQCGALADDVLGPIAADYLEVLRRSGPGQTTSGGDLIAVLRQRVLRLPNGVGSGDGDGDGLDAAPPAAAFTGAAAVTMARLLGRAAIPGHHQLHRIFHLALLPEVTRVLGRAAERATQGVADEATGEAIEALPGAAVLLDLTAALRHYAVSGHAVTHLTTLWTAYFAHRPRTDDAAAALADCTALLRALSSVPSASSRTQRRQARNICADGSHGGLNATQQRNQLLKVTDGDYYPLVDVVCAQVCRLCNHLLSPAATNDVATVAPTQLLALLCLLLRVSSPHWAETYEMLASAVLAALAYTAASLAALAPSRPEDDELERLLPLAAARRTLHALLHRNSLIPDHPLHRVLLRRLLHSPAAMTDTAVASQVLLGLELMVPEEEGSARTNGASAATAMPAAAEGISRSNNAVAATTATSASAGPTVALVATATGTAAQTLMSTVAITPDDRHRALQVFRRLGRSVTPTAFVAGLCVVALDTLPRTAQVAVVNHLTSVASAVSPSYLVKGMDAVVRQLPTSAIDDVSVQHWFSRFTARDVVRRVDPVGCAVLLDMLSANPRYQRNCALAKECITRRIGVALRQTGEDGVGNDAASAVSLDALPRVVAALQRANVFLPQYYSRVCRLLLGQVGQAPLGEALQPFAVVAEAYMSRQRSEAQASVFKDVWELLRGRVMEEAGRLTLHETLMAINGFAALDVTDHALFGVLVYQLWVCLCTAEAQVANVPAMRPAHSVQQPRENGEAAEAAAATTDDKDEAAEAKVYRRVQAAQHVLRTLTPSAVAVVTVTLLVRSDVRASYAAQARGVAAVGVVRKDEDEDDNAVRTLLPWMLLGLRDCREELYPVDVVHLMPSLLEHYAAAATVEDASAPATAYTDRCAALLHNAYDACRSTFLLMYALLPDAVAAAEEPLLPLAEQQRIAEQRSQWTPATKLSVEVVPRPWFATLLVSLSSAALVDVAVALACVRRACTRRVCSDLLPISQLVDVCLSLCWLTTSTGLRTTTKSPSATAHRSADDAQAPATPPVTRQDELSSPLPAPGDVLRTAMATVLSALWKRNDELTSAQIGALLRCLRDTYGADTVDADFVERLEAQKALLLSQRQQKRPAAAAAGPVSATEAANGGSDGASAAAPPQQQRPKPLPRMDPEDLFRTT